MAAAIATPALGRAGEAVEAAAALQAQGIGMFAVQPPETARTHSDSLDLALHLQHQAGAETIAARGDLGQDHHDPAGRPARRARPGPARA